MQHTSVDCCVFICISPIFKFARDHFSTRSNNNVVDGNKDELDEEPHKSHHDEANSGTKSHLSKFFTIRLVATLDKANAVLGEIPQWIEDVVQGIHCYDLQRERERVRRGRENSKMC